MATPKLVGTPRDRLLAAANELFYEEGVHTVGIDRVIERAGVAKASLYSSFGSKDELVRAYLEQRAETRQQRIRERIAKHAEPRDQLLAVFDALGETMASPSYRGCAFVNASAEGRRDDRSPVSRVCTDYRTWIRDLFSDLAQQCGVKHADELGRQLVALYDGAVVAASMDHDHGAAKRAKQMAAALLDAQPRTAKRT